MIVYDFRLLSASSEGCDCQNTAQRLPMLPAMLFLVRDHLVLGHSDLLFQK